MQQKYVDLIKEAADVVGLDVEVYNGYSGRGMYGKETTAVVCDFDDFLVCACQVSADLAEDQCSRRGSRPLGPDSGWVDENPMEVEGFIEEMRAVRTDNMGLSSVFY